MSSTPQYNRFRFYSPLEGRYLEADPLGLSAGPGLYVYASNAPLGEIDPMGLYGWDVHWGKTFDWGEDLGLGPDARRIADANQGMDDWYRREWWPFNLNHPWNLLGGCQQHFRHLGGVEADLETALQECDVGAFGRHLHSLQDTFTHKGFSCWGLGHAPHSVGKWIQGQPHTDVYDPTSPRDQLMELVTKHYLRQWRDRCRPCSTTAPY